MNCLSKPSAPRKGYTYPQPLERYIAAFDRSLVTRRVGRKVPEQASRALWNFFARFPTRHDPANIYITDTEDWKKIRAEEVRHNTVRWELGFVRAFYNFINREFDLDIPNPVKEVPVE